MLLNDLKLKSAKPTAKEYRLNDGHGLSCLIQPIGRKFWRFRYQWQGKERMLSMGEYPATSLKLARDKRDDARKLLAQGLDPSGERQKEKREGSARRYL